MRKYSFIVYLFGILLFFVDNAHAQQKEIVLDADLATGSEKLKVKMGTQWMNKIWKFKFGNYEVLDSKSGWTVTTSNSKLFSFKVQSESGQKFSFNLGNKTKDTAVVNVVFSIKTEELQAIPIFSNFYVGPNFLLKESQNFTGFISTTSDVEDTWVLIMKLSEGSEVGYENDAFLTNGETTIDIIPTSSNKHGGDSREYPALGYEFVEKDQALCAMQYYGGGAFGYNKNIVWLKSDLDERFKLILAAAMTALLQKEVTQMADID
jgi:hypothetical protein